MRKTSKVASLVRNKFVLRQSDIADTANRELFAQGLVDVKHAKDGHQQTSFAQDDLVLLAQAEIVLNDAGNAGLAGNPPTLIAAVEAPNPDAVTAITPAPAASAAGAVPTVAASSAVATGAGYSVLTYGVAAVGIGAAVSVGAKKKSTDSAPPVTITGTAAELATGGAKHALIVSGVNVTVTDAATLAQLASIDTAKGAGGALTYTAVTDTAANLSSNTGAYVKAGSNVTVTDAATVAQLTAISATGAGMAYTAINDTAANLMPSGGVVSPFITKSTNVTVAGISTLSQLAALNSIAASVTGLNISDTLANLMPNGTVSPYITKSTNVIVADLYSIAQLAALNLTAASVTGLNISDTLANLMPGGTVSSFIKSGSNVTVTDTATIAQLTALHAVNGAGALTYTTLSDVAANLAPGGIASTYITGGVKVTVTDAATVAQLTAINTAKGTGTLTYTALSDTVANLAPNGAASTYILNGSKVTVTGGASLAQLAVIDAAKGTGGTLTYAAIMDTAANLITNTGAYVKAGINLTVTDLLSISQLAALNLTAASVTGMNISDTIANLMPGGTVSSFIKSGSNVTVTDTPTIAQLTALHAVNGAGALTYATLSDVAANLAPGGVASTYILNGSNVTVTDAATVAQLTAINTAKGSGTLAYTALADTAANLTPGGAVSTYILNGSKVTVTDAATVAQLTAINTAKGTGTLTYAAIMDTAANLLPGGVVSTYVTIGANVTVTDLFTVGQLAALNLNAKSVTGLNISDTVANLMPGGTVSSFIKSGSNVTVTDTATIAQLTALHTANGTGALTAASLADTAANLTPGGVASAYITSGSKVTVTDLLSIGQLTVLKLTAASVTGMNISDTITNLMPGGTVSSFIKSGSNVTVTDTPTIAQLTALHAVNGAGALTYASLADTAANLTSGGIASIYITNGANVTVTDAATVAQLTLINTAKGTGTLAYAALSDTAANLTPGGAVSTYILNGSKVTVTDGATLSQLALIDAAKGTGGTLTYTAVADKTANLLANTTAYIKAGNKLTVTDSASLAQLTLIDAAKGTGSTLVYTSVADTLANLTANAGGYVKAGVNATVTDSATIAQLVGFLPSLNGATVSGLNISDIAANLAPNAVAVANITTGSNVTVTDVASIAQLTAIKNASGTGALNYTAVTDIANNLSQNGVASAYLRPGVNVTVTDGASIMQLTAIAVSVGTAGVLTYSGVKDTLANLAANLGGYVQAGKTVTVFDTAAHLVSNVTTPVYNTTGLAVVVDDASVAASIAQLTTIHQANGAAAALSYTVIADTLANLTANTGGYVKAGINLQVNDAASQFTVAQLGALKTIIGTGTVTVTAGTIADSSLNLFPNGIVASYITSGVAVTVTDVASIAQLTAIKAANGLGQLSYSAVTDTIANLTAPTATTYLSTGNNLTVTVTDVATIGQLTALKSIAGVTVVPTSISDTMANLFANSVASQFITLGVAVTVTDAISLAALSAIHAANGTASVSYTAITDTLANLNANALLAANAGGYIANNTNLVVTDVATIAQLDALHTHNAAGSVVANNINDTVTNIVIGGVASNYIASGTTVTINEVTGPVVSIANLLAIQAKNGTGTINYTAISDIAANLVSASGVVSSFIIARTNVTVTGTATIAQLHAIDVANMTGTLTFTAIRDTTANLTAPTATPYLIGGTNVTVTDPISIAQLAIIENNTGRQATIAGGLIDTAAHLAPTRVADAHITPGVAVTVTGSISIAKLAVIYAANSSAPVTYTTIADTLVNINANIGGYVKNGINLQVKDVGVAISVAQLNALSALNGTGAVTAASITDTAANLVPNGTVSGKIAANTDVTITDAASVAQLTAIHNVNIASLIHYTAVTDTIGNLEPNGVSNFISVGTAVTVTGTASITQLAALDAVTLTTHAAVTSISDTAANLAPNGIVSTFINSGLIVNVNVTDTIGYTELANISNLNGGGTVTYHSVRLDSGVYGGTLALNAGTGLSDVIQLSSTYSSIDFSQFNSTSKPVIKHFEIVDMSKNPGASSVTLTAADLFNINSDLTDATVTNNLGAAHVLVINGSSTSAGLDVANISAGGFAIQGAANSYTATGSTGTGYSKYIATYSDTAGAHLVEVLLQTGVIAA